MDLWFIVTIVLFTVFLISLPFYVLFLFAIIKYRKQHPFNSTFFNICFVMGIVDIVALMRTWFLVRFPHFRWLGMNIVVKKYPKGLSKFAYITSIYAAQAQGLLVLVMALNRYSALITPFLYQQKWNKQQGVKYLIVATPIPLIVCIPQLFTGHEYIINNETGIIEGTRMANNNIWAAPYYLLLIANGILITISTGFIYTILFWKRHKQLHKDSQGRSNKQRENDKSDLKYAFVGISLFVPMAAMTMCTCLWATAGDSATIKFFMKLYLAFADILGWINIWTLMAVSKHVRKHMFSALKCTPPLKKRIVKEVKHHQAITPAVHICST